MLDDHRRKAVAAVGDFSHRASLPSASLPGYPVNLTKPIEPLLQKIEAQHPLDPDRRAAIARLGIERRDQPAQRRPWHNPLHLGQKRRPPRRLGVAFKPDRRQCQLLHPPNHSAPIRPSTYYITITGRWLVQSFPNRKGLLVLEITLHHPHPVSDHLLASTVEHDQIPQAGLQRLVICRSLRAQQCEQQY